MELDLNLSEAVLIDKIELIQWRDHTFVRVSTREGRTGVATAGEPFARVRSLLLGDVIPLFLRKDARELPALIEAAVKHESLQTLAGPAVWSCIAWIEFATLDLLGKIAGKPIGEMLGGIVRVEVPVYLSSVAGAQLPEVEIRHLSERLAATGARAVKLRVGATDSDGAGCAKRAAKLLELARRAWDESITLYADLAGSCDADNAVEVSHILKAFDVGLMENPCPADDFESIRQVTETVGIRVAWGRAECSLPRWRWAIEHRQADVMMPSVVTNGGLMRTSDIADAIGAAGLQTTPHCIGGGLDVLYSLHLISRTRLVGPFQEYRFNRVPPAWCTPNIELIDGNVMVPTGPGLGIEIDNDIWREASTILT